LRNLHADHGRQSFAHIVAAQIFLYIFEQAGRLPRRVDGARERGAKAGQMRAAIHRIDVVGETEKAFRIAVVILQRDFHRQRSRIVGQLPVGFEVDGLFVQHRLAAVQVPDELRDAAKVKEFVVLHRIDALVAQVDLQALVQERQLAQPLRQRVVVIGGFHHDGGIRLERNARAGLAAGFARPHQRTFGMAAGKLHLPGIALAPDLQFQPLGERVHAAYADAVQATRYFVALGIELAAGVQFGHHHFRRRDAFLVHIHRDAAAVIRHRYGIVDMNDHVDLRAIAGQGLIDGVVHHLVNQVMQPHLTGRADIHSRPQAHGLQTFQNLDTAGIVNLRGAAFV